MRSELIDIAEYRRRAWGENGTPLTRQAIRNQIVNGVLPGKRCGKKWFVDWAAYQAANGDDLVANVLRGR